MDVDQIVTSFKKQIVVSATDAPKRTFEQIEQENRVQEQQNAHELLVKQRDLLTNEYKNLIEKLSTFECEDTDCLIGAFKVLAHHMSDLDDLQYGQWIRVLKLLSRNLYTVRIAAAAAEAKAEAAAGGGSSSDNPPTFQFRITRTPSTGHGPPNQDYLNSLASDFEGNLTSIAENADATLMEMGFLAGWPDERLFGAQEEPCVDADEADDAEADEAEADDADSDTEADANAELAEAKSHKLLIEDAVNVLPYDMQNTGLAALDGEDHSFFAHSFDYNVVSDEEGGGEQIPHRRVYYYRNAIENVELPNRFGDIAAMLRHMIVLSAMLSNYARKDIDCTSSTSALAALPSNDIRYETVVTMCTEVHEFVLLNDDDVAEKDVVIRYKRMMEALRWLNTRPENVSTAQAKQWEESRAGPPGLLHRIEKKCDLPQAHQEADVQSPCHPLVDLLLATHKFAIVCKLARYAPGAADKAEKKLYIDPFPAIRLTEEDAKRPAEQPAANEDDDGEGEEAEECDDCDEDDDDDDKSVDSQATVVDDS